jgi:hypothetical protein
MSADEDESNGVSAGGKWMVFRAEDKMTGAKKLRFELLANNYLSEGPDYKPRVELVCTDGKYSYADFNPGIRLGPPNRPGFWGQPQMEVMVRVDDTHGYHGWNWIRGRFLSMDKVDRSASLQRGTPRSSRFRNRGILARRSRSCPG